MAAWQIQDAKARLGEVIERARREGPQTIAGEGSERAVVLSIERMTARSPQGSPISKPGCSAGRRWKSLIFRAIRTLAVASSYRRWRAICSTRT